MQDSTVSGVRCFVGINNPNFIFVYDIKIRRGVKLILSSEILAWRNYDRAFFDGVAFVNV